MPALPDSFDLQVRRARQASPERQIDFLIGSLFGLNEWVFLNHGSAEQPVPAVVELDEMRHILVFSSVRRADDWTEETGQRQVKDPLSFFTVPVDGAPLYVLGFRAVQVQAILVNPGDYAYSVSCEAVENFYQEWKQRTRSERQGFWIPHLTTEEEDFWQAHGIE